MDTMQQLDDALVECGMPPGGGPLYLKWCDVFEDTKEWLLKERVVSAEFFSSFGVPAETLPTVTFCNPVCQKLVMRRIATMLENHYCYRDDYFKNRCQDYWKLINYETRKVGRCPRG